MKELFFFKKNKKKKDSLYKCKQINKKINSFEKK